MKSLFEYLDYRDYLKDFYDERKSEHAYFSYRLFGSKIDLDSSYLAKVLIKDRHIAEKTIKKVIEYCGFCGKEAEYFESLVHFVKAKTLRESKYFFEKLLALKSVSTRTIVNYQYEFYQKWYYSAIRSLLEFYEFKDDYKALAEQLSPAITVKEAKTSVQLLEKLQMIKRDSQGIYRLTDCAITTGSQWHSIAIETFQRESIRLSEESLTRHKKKHRDISTITMNINETDFQEIRQRIKEFRDSIIKYVNEQKTPDRVVQLNIQIFPFSKIEGDSE